MTILLNCEVPKQTRMLWRDFKGGTGTVFAEGLRRAEQVALAVNNHSQRILSVGGREFMDHAVRPLAVLLRSQFKHNSAVVSVTIGQASVSSAVEVSRLVKYHRIPRIAAIGALREFVDVRFLPLAACERKLEDRAIPVAAVAATVMTARHSAAVEVACAVHH